MRDVSGIVWFKVYKDTVLGCGVGPFMCRVCLPVCMYRSTLYSCSEEKRPGLENLIEG